MKFLILIISFATMACTSTQKPASEPEVKFGTKTYVIKQNARGVVYGQPKP